MTRGVRDTRGILIEMSLTRASACKHLNNTNKKSLASTAWELHYTERKTLVETLGVRPATGRTCLYGNNNIEYPLACTHTTYIGTEDGGRSVYSMDNFSDRRPYIMNDTGSGNSGPNESTSASLSLLHCNFLQESTGAAFLLEF